jgi:putative endonuclease
VPQSVPMAAKDELGRRGEELAAAWLEGQGLAVLARNWRCSEGELDIVATDRKVVVICEVKTRSGDRFGSPFEAVTQGKRRKLRRLAMLWVIDSKVKGFPRLRFDVIGVLWRPGQEPTIEHRAEAF